jgi:intein/homing endonuclease
VQRLIHITLETGEKLTATDGHPFKTTEGWRDAIMLKKGGKLLLKGAGEEEDAERSEEGERVVTIKDIQIEQKIVPAYNLEVANAHTFFVGEDGVLAHNAKKARESEKRRCTDIPNWFKGKPKPPGDTPSEMADNAMNTQYGRGNWDRKHPDYSPIRKHISMKWFGHR